ncbi:MAG TPA: EscU/YscU/HrcU family type III secretion system export apparatus switch protein [Desulfuromonadales bacterium]|nr:EscU/YscU/HrcU family type III secretion system export apparatus switch protein [Desulfuromonadales bacterium]
MNGSDTERKNGLRADAAVALLYDREKDGAPRVVASGKGELATRIIATAREAGVQITKDPDLLEILAKVPIGEEIPAELYQAVAEILSFVYRVNGRYREVAP